MKKFTTVMAALFLVFACAGSFAADKKSPAEQPVMAIVEQVNINSADAEAIAAGLERVGLKKAEAIVEWRKANGKFTSVEQLLEVKGIGEATLERNRSRIKL